MRTRIKTEFFRDKVRVGEFLTKLSHSVTSPKEFLAKRLKASYIIAILYQDGTNTVNFVANYEGVNEVNVLKNKVIGRMYECSMQGL